MEVSTDQANGNLQFSPQIDYNLDELRHHELMLKKDLERLNQQIARMENEFTERAERTKNVKIDILKAQSQWEDVNNAKINQLGRKYKDLTVEYDYFRKGKQPTRGRTSEREEFSSRLKKFRSGMLELSKKFDAVSNNLRARLEQFDQNTQSENRKRVSEIVKCITERQAVEEKQDKVTSKLKNGTFVEHSEKVDQKESDNVKEATSAPNKSTTEAVATESTAPKFGQTVHKRKRFTVGIYKVTKMKLANIFWGELLEARSSEKNEIYAAKVIDLTKQREDHRDHLLHNTMKTLPLLVGHKCETVAGIYDRFMLEGKRLIIIEEYMFNTLDTIVKDRGPLNEEATKQNARSLTDALCFLHKLEIAHQNVSSYNIFENLSGKLKLSSMEYAVQAREMHGSVIHMHKCCANVAGRHVAPEISSGLFYDPIGVDIYGLGLTVCFMFLGEYPFNNDPAKSLSDQENGLGSLLRKKVTPDALNFILGCVEQDPARRMTAKRAIGHAWFKST